MIDSMNHRHLTKFKEKFKARIKKFVKEFCSKSYRTQSPSLIRPAILAGDIDNESFVAHITTHTRIMIKVTFAIV